MKSGRPPQAGDRRREAFLLGLRAESIAAFWLRAKGYRILERRYLAFGGEIDLIAARGNVIAMVEVKARPTVEEAMASITPDKARRMSRAARHWLARAPGVEQKTWRGDAIFLTPRSLPRHAPGFIPLDLS